jgi:hypothetical protein
MVSQSSLRACIKKQFCAEGRSFVVEIYLDIGHGFLGYTRYKKAKLLASL